MKRKSKMVTLEKEIGLTIFILKFVSPAKLGIL